MSDSARNQAAERFGAESPQLDLGLVAPERTRCGYCGRELEQLPAGNWECPRCGPLLHTLDCGPEFSDWVRTWGRFQREAAQDWVGPR